jgi:hypothetical protein
MQKAKSAASIASGLSMAVVALGFMLAWAGPALALEAPGEGAAGLSDGNRPPFESETPVPEEDEPGPSIGDAPFSDETPGAVRPDLPDGFGGCPVNERPLELLI